jgi:hypothetical protein
VLCLCALDTAIRIPKTDVPEFVLLEHFWHFFPLVLLVHVENCCSIHAINPQKKKRKKKKRTKCDVITQPRQVLAQGSMKAVTRQNVAPDIFFFFFQDKRYTLQSPSVNKQVGEDCCCTWHMCCLNAAHNNSFRKEPPSSGQKKDKAEERGPGRANLLWGLAQEALRRSLVQGTHAYADGEQGP